MLAQLENRSASHSSLHTPIHTHTQRKFLLVEWEESLLANMKLAIITILTDNQIRLHEEAETSDELPKKGIHVVERSQKFL